jgi:acyl-CoA thioesterase-2
MFGVFDLEAHGPDTFVGTGPRYPWGGLYGGQVVAQALRAAAASIDPDFQPHSIRAYFIRPGDHSEPVRYEVDRIRNGRSFVTRRVVARQAIGAILNAECSFQRSERSASLQTIPFPDVPGPDGLENSSFSEHFDRRFIDQAVVRESVRDGIGRVTAWMKVTQELDESSDRNAPFLHQCWLAYLSDDLASDTVRAAHRTVYAGDQSRHLPGISLDHTVWFHRPLRADRWQLHDFSCHHYAGSRGLAIGHVFDDHGVHVATVSQEVLMREPRD